eukprot:jgi/Bigna1/126865/aug1.3_g1573
MERTYPISEDEENSLEANRIEKIFAFAFTKQLFEARVASKRRTSGAKKSRSRARHASKSSKVSLLDSQREVNVGILLSKFKMSPEMVREAVETLDLGFLTQDVLAGLIKVLPTEEELKVLKAFKGPPSMLTDTSRFQMIVGTIHDVKTRLQHVLFMCQVPESFSSLRVSLRLVNRALRAIRSSSALKQLLHLVLSIGNHMNFGTRKGNASGFDIQLLLTLSAIKATDRKSSLLDYIVGVMEGSGKEEEEVKQQRQEQQKQQPTGGGGGGRGFLLGGENKNHHREEKDAATARGGTGKAEDDEEEGQKEEKSKQNQQRLQQRRRRSILRPSPSPSPTTTPRRRQRKRKGGNHLNSKLLKELNPVVPVGS